MYDVLDPPLTPDPAVADEATPPPAAERPPRRWWQSPPNDPRWVRPALLTLLVATAVLYLWGLSASGWGNSYYAAAVQAGTKSWKAFFYGSTDASNFITVDKTPASLWPAVVSARIFGVSSWSILAPQAIEGVAAVGLLYLTVRRWFGPAAGLLAGAVLATTPVATLMFRYNNPDALLVLTLVAAAYCLTRAIEADQTRWVVLTGVALGIAFLAKELQAFLVIPGFAIAYLVAAPGSWWRRVRQGVVMAAAMVVSAGWWIAIVMLTPAADRPYIGGSQNNTFWNVLFGYNGFGRLSGNETGSVGAGPGGNGRTGAWGATGWTRMFNSQFGGEASWLLPTALALLAIGLCVTIRRSRTDRTRAALIIWGGWLLVTGIAFSLGQGIIHEYYAVALAPAIGAVVGIGSVTLWRARAAWWSRLAMVATWALTIWWIRQLLERSPDWHPYLRDAVLVAALLVGGFLLANPTRRWLAGLVAGGAVAVALAAPTAASVTTARTSHQGPLPTSGPAVTNGQFGRGPGGFGPGGGLPGRGGAPAGGFPGGAGFPAGGPPAGGFPAGGLPAGGFPGGGFPGGGMPGGGIPGGGTGARTPGGAGGIFGSPTPGATLTKLIAQARTGGYRWAAATIGATNGAGIQLASGQPIMAIGGFNGSDPTPTLSEFKRLVGQGSVHYFIASNFGVPGGGQSGTGTAISSWVSSTFGSRTVDGVTIYDLSRPRTAGS